MAFDDPGNFPGRMNTIPQRQEIIRRLNASALSQHLIGLGLSRHPQGLVLLDLLEWAVENHYQNQLVGEMELGAAVWAEADDPEALYDNLMDQRMLQAKSLEEASACLVSRIVDLLGRR